MAQSPYSRPQIYELAFGFRDYSLAVDFLTEAAARAGLREITSVLELGCGPAQYAREFARRGIKATGVDLSKEMVTYAATMSAREMLPCRIIQADMRSFVLSKKADLAVCMIATICLLLTNDDMVKHLQCVADNLTSGGLYIVEMPHPCDIFSGESEGGAQNQWVVEEDGIKIATDWGSDAEMDFVNEINTGTVKYTVTQNDKTETFENREQWRDIPFGLMKALIDLSGRFELIDSYGDLDIKKPFNNEKTSWRMLLVLREKAGEQTGRRQEK